MMSKDVFVTFDGGEGAGKSTQIAALAKLLNDCGREVCVCREPGGTRLGESIRALLLDPGNVSLDATAELLLYEAARAQIVSEVIAPALQEGKVVLCDRFYDSTTAYQGYGRGLDIATIDRLNAIAAGGLVPDRTIFLQIPAEMGLARVAKFVPDRMEGAGGAFHKRVHEGFAAIAEKHPERIREVSADGSAMDILLRILAELDDLLPELSTGDAAGRVHADTQRYLGILAR